MSNALAKRDRERAMLAKARTVPEVKKIRDMAEAAKAYAKKAKLGLEEQNHFAEIALEAARKAGAILKQLEKTPPQSAAKVAGDSEYRKTLKATGTPERTARYWQKLSKVTEHITQRYFAKVRKAEKGEITAAGLLREAGRVGRVVHSSAASREQKRAAMETGTLGLFPVEAWESGLKVKDLATKFLAPPFSTLDLKQKYLLKLKGAWEGLGIRGEAGRGDEHEAVHSTGILDFDSRTNISVFNPAVTEIMYRWFAPEGGHILDPFAGGPTRGIVAASRHYKYTGIELRAEQVEENRKQAARMWVRPKWICGDSSQLSRHVDGQEFDLIFTCPPYYDLETYTEAGEGDLSRCKTYENFMARYEDIFRQAAEHLKQDRFAVVVVGEIRDKKGWYRNFVGDTVSCFQRLGLHYYNEIILLDPIGSAPGRAGKIFSSYRKVAKVHQNVLVFWKGDDVKRIPEALGVLEDVNENKGEPPAAQITYGDTPPLFEVPGVSEGKNEPAPRAGVVPDRVLRMEDGRGQ